ncbi:hypothetical protein KAT63_04225 [Candidatus Parcubacteria bacterium]|nr:hypothetical protein [Candidatus Parcubacteria bacterium]
MKKINKIFLTLFAVLFVVLSLIGLSHNASAALGTPTCAPNDGCLPTCVGPADPDCTNLGVPGLCPKLQGSKGLVPCGKNYDDPDTDWDECAPCNLCSLIFMGQLIIEFLLKITAVISVLAIAAGGFLYMFAAGSQGTIDSAKSIIKYVLFGFVVVFVSWAIVGTILTMFGYIDPIGGEWYMMDC